MPERGKVLMSDHARYKRTAEAFRASLGSYFCRRLCLYGLFGQERAFPYSRIQ